MKSGGPWNLRGLRPRAREAAREAAHRSGMSVGEWLNSVIQPDDDEEVGPPPRSADFDHAAEARWRQSSRDGDQERGRRRDADRRGRERGEDDEAPTRRAGGPYREARGRDRADRSRRERERDDERKAARAREEAREAARMHENLREAAREELGEVNERLDNLSRQIERLARLGAAASRPASRQRRSPPAPGEPGNESLTRLTGAPQPPPRAVTEAAADNRGLSIEQAVAEITARQRALEGEAFAQPAPLSSVPPENHPARPASAHAEDAPVAAIDLSGLERQLRQITTRIEALRPASDLEKAMSGLRGDLSEIGRLITEALPRRAVESLEIEVKALAQRIDHSRQSGVDSGALAGLEHGLAEVREALRGLTTAESLVGVDEAVKALAQKVDLIVAKQDPAALQQLETAIGALRGIVSHVASNDALTKVAEDVRSLAAKVDGLANSTASGHAISALENRIDTLASALNASTEAGHAVPRELEKLLAGLIEKLEWVQLTHTDHAALAHLEDRIAMLVKRLDASDARLGQLAGVERGLTDLLVHLEQMRGGNGKGGDGAKGKPAVAAIERDVAEIKQSERRTQDSLEAVQGTVEHVVDRLATIESNIRGDKTRAAPAQPLPAQPASSPPASLPTAAVLAAPAVPAAQAAGPKPAQIEPAPPRSAGPRPPIDPNLPPDHPLEPGSAGGRSLQPPSAADRIAASEAAIGAKPPVIPDPGGKPDFIAAARRAARTAALASPDRQPSEDAAASGASLPKKLTQRLRALIVAAAVVLIVVGCLHIVTRLFDDGAANAPAEVQTEKPSPPAAALPEGNPTKLPTPETVPLAVPGGKPATNAGAPTGASPASPAPSPGAPTGAKPKRQSLNDSPEFSALTAQTPSADTAALWSSPEFTGSLPRPPATQNTATAPAAAVADDKLPATIGGPTLRAAALAGDAAAAYEVAARFAEGRGVAQNSEEAAHWFDRAAKMGLAPAQFRLGSFYEKGVGVKKDLAAARDLYRAAADKGHGKAMHNLAVLYAEGIEGAADYRAAAQWFRKAADHGVTDSQYNLGILYARGIGVEQNFAESYKWFFLAAKQGDGDAAKKRDEVAAHLDRESLAAARLAAQAWTAQPQPADAITVKVPPAWNPPANGAPAARSKPRFTGAKTPPPDFTKID